MDRPKLRPAQVAELLGCSVSMVSKLFAAGELPGYRVGRLVWIWADGVEEFVARNANGPPTKQAPVEIPAPESSAGSRSRSARRVPLLPGPAGFRHLH